MYSRLHVFDVLIPRNRMHVYLNLYRLHFTTYQRHWKITNSLKVQTKTSRQCFSALWGTTVRLFTKLDPIWRMATLHCICIVQHHKLRLKNECLIGWCRSRPIQCNRTTVNIYYRTVVPFRLFVLERTRPSSWRSSGNTLQHMWWSTSHPDVPHSHLNTCSIA